jgi:hypothetical protein
VQNSKRVDVGSNVYLSKAFHACLNRNRYMEQHRMGWHSDQYAESYVPDDPITGLSWQATGVLLLDKKGQKGNVPSSDEKVLVSLSGDVYIMGGMFQENFVHAVPPVRDWPAILKKHMHSLNSSEIEAMETEIRLADQQSRRTRFNITVRWHNVHKECSATWRQSSPTESSRLSVAQMAQRIEASAGSDKAPLHGTQAPVPARSAAASPPGIAAASTAGSVCVAVQTEADKSQLDLLQMAGIAAASTAGSVCVAVQTEADKSQLD